MQNAYAGIVCLNLEASITIQFLMSYENEGFFLLFAIKIDSLML
jgi:hypothetical protein